MLEKILNSAKFILDIIGGKGRLPISTLLGIIAPHLVLQLPSSGRSRDTDDDLGFAE